MRVVSLVLCEAANIQADGRFNLLGGGIQRVFSAKFPAHVRFALVVQILADGPRKRPETEQLSIRLIDDDGRDIMPRLNSEIKFGANRRDANILLDMNNLRFEGPGQFTFTVLINGEEQAYWNVEVKDAPPPKT